MRSQALASDDNKKVDLTFCLLEQALSPSLKMELIQSIYVPVLRAIPLFDAPDLTEFVEDLAMCLEVMTLLPDDLIISRGERGADCFFIVLNGSVKVFGHSELGAHEIMAADDYPFFGIAEMLAKDECEQLEHRSVVATTICDLARVKGRDWEEITTHFPQIQDGMVAIAQAELADVLQLDKQMVQAELRGKFEARLNVQLRTAASDSKSEHDMDGRQSGSAAASPQNSTVDQRLHKEQLRLLVRELNAELTDLDLQAAMAVMDPSGTGGVTFDEFCLWWNSKTRNTATLRGIPTRSAAARTSLISTERDVGRQSRSKPVELERTTAGGSLNGVQIDGGASDLVRLSKLEATVLKTQGSLNDLRRDLGGQMDTLDCKLDLLSRSVGESVDSLLGELRTLRGDLTQNTGQDREDKVVGSNSCMSGSDLGRSRELSQESSECDKDDESSRDMVRP